MTRPDVCVVGSLNMDITLRVARIPVEGETILARERLLASGGKGANQAVAAAAAGANVSMLGAVGEDDDGAAALDSLRRRGVDVGGVGARPDAPTGTAIVMVSDSGDNAIVVDAGANASLDPAWVTSRLTELGPKVTLVQLEVPADCVAAVVDCAGRGRVILNPAPMQDSEMLRRAMAGVDVLVPNRTELAGLVGRREPRTAEEVDACVAGLGFSGDVVVTLGADGSRVYPRRGKPVEIPPVSVVPRDTSGAGDVFCGVLAARLAEGFDLETAAAQANQAASISTTFPGARLPDSYQVDRGANPSAAMRNSAAPVDRTPSL